MLFLLRPPPWNPGWKPTFFFKRKGIVPGYHPVTVAFIAALESAAPPVVLPTGTKDLLDVFVWDIHGRTNPDYATTDMFSKFAILYVMLGGNSFSHSLNLVDPATYPISWAGSPTHDANGVHFNAVNQYGNTGFTPDATGNGVVPGNAHLSYFNPQEISATDVWIDFGAASGGGVWFFLSIDDLYDDAYVSGSNSRKVSYVNTGPKAVFAIGTSQSNTLRKVFHNGVFKAQHTGNASGDQLPAKPLWIGGPNWTSGLANPSGRPCAFASAGKGLTDTEVSCLTNAVRALQTGLGRWPS